MIIRKLDDDGDWKFGNGLQDYATGQAAIHQSIRSRVMSWKNDCFFALDQGVDWQSGLEIGQQAILETDIKGVILRTFGVVGVNLVSVEFDAATRAAGITYEADDIYTESFQRAVNQAAGT